MDNSINAEDFDPNSTMRYLNPNEGPDVQTNKFSDFLDTPNGEKSLHLSKINEEKSELEIDRVNSSFNP